MTVKRLSDEALDKILHNQVFRPVNIVIKFYTNTCPMCHALQEYYEDIATSFSEDKETYFFAYNVSEDTSIEKMLNFNGVTTIAIVKPDPNMPKQKLSKFKIMPDPESPHEKTWYRSKEIRDFIERNT